MDQEKINEIIQFWFGDIDPDDDLKDKQEITSRWFRSDPVFDKEIKKRFGDDVKKATKGEYDDWAVDALGRLALILLLDQFTRNIYRGTAKAFATDIKALELCVQGIKEGHDKKLMLVERQFLFLPLMHSENLEVQKQSCLTFEKLARLAEETEDPSIDYFKNVVTYAQKHFDVIKEFGRFPQRNQALGRRSTSDELNFLGDPAGAI